MLFQVLVIENKKKNDKAVAIIGPYKEVGHQDGLVVKGLAKNKFNTKPEPLIITNKQKPKQTKKSIKAKFAW